MKEILVLLSGGLGNRINLLLSALSYYEKNPIPMNVIWLVNTELFCDFESLFQPISIPNIRITSLKINSTDIDYSKYSKCLFICRYIHKDFFKQRYAIPDIHEFYCISSFSYLKEPNFVSLPKDLSSEISTLAFIEPNFLPFSEDYSKTLDFFIRHFVPKSLSFLLDFLKQHTPSIGVHIRLTDKKILNGYSDENLQADIESVFSNLADKKVFICSDDIQVENRVISYYTNCFNFEKINPIYMNSSIIVREKETCLDTIVDFFVFCACPLKIGINSNETSSTFFQTASLLQDTFRNVYGLNQ